MNTFASVKLYVLLTEERCAADWYDTAQAVLTGGATAIQLREKHLDDRRLLDRACRLRELCSDHGALLIINDRADIASAAGAHGVHVGQSDLPLRQVRRVLHQGGIVGVSTHSIEQVRAALVDPPDYVAVGPMFSSTTKPGITPAGPALLEQARPAVSMPLIAIGGITDLNAGRLTTADALAVCSAVTAAPDPAAAAKAILDAFVSETRKSGARGAE